MGRRKEAPAGIQLDFLTPAEANEELKRLAAASGYGTNVGEYLANEGQIKKHVPKAETSIRHLERNTVIKDGLKSKVDPHFHLFHQFMEEARDDKHQGA